MAELIFLGTAGAVASKTRDNTSFLLRNENELILIDTPGSLIHKLEKIKRDFRKIKTLLFTHSHPDHIYGIVSFIHSQYKLKNILQIYATNKTITIIKTLRKIFSLKNQKLYPRLIFHPLKNEYRAFYDSKGLKIFFFKTKHSDGSVGFRIVFKNKNIVISGDTPFDPRVIKEATRVIKEAKGSYILIHDCFSPEKFFKKYPFLNKKHTSSLKLGILAQEIHPQILIPVHFSSELKYSFSEILGEIRKNFKGRIIIPYDFLKISF
ncbi:MAG: ribonuclease Z [Candidatus Omnitrophica bacterium]|nr:ribonuclease Z [Candidatus Omnitrophota bacterium]